MGDSDRSYHQIRKEDLEEYKLGFQNYDKDGSGLVERGELVELFRDLNICIPKLRMREIAEEYGTEIDFGEFKEIVGRYSTTQQGAGFRAVLKKRANVEKTGGSTYGSSLETTHSYSESEVTAFADWINTQLEKEDKLGDYLPIDSSSKSKDLFVKTSDGVILCKLINATVSGTIDERVINFDKKDTFSKRENLTLAINSASSIGCQIVNIGAGDLLSGKPHLVLGLMWQIIRIGLFSHITLAEVPGLVQLLLPGEDPSVLHRMTPEELLLRWVNFHLQAAGSSRRVRNFSEDIKDSEVYSVLLYRVAPEKAGVDNPNKYEAIKQGTDKAEALLKNAEKINCRKFVRAKDIVEGNDKLNLAFVANLFNHYPGLSQSNSHQRQDNYDDPEETREEKTYRNWMNSLGVHPFVTWLYTDLSDGHVLFQLFDLIRPNAIDKRKTETIENCCKTAGGKYAMMSNCCYAVQLGKDMGLQMQSIGGEDIFCGHEKLTKGMVWQMLRAYTMSILSGLEPEEPSDTSPTTVDSKIINWVNDELKKGGKKTTIRDFRDGSIATSLPVIDLVDVISKKYFRCIGATAEKRSVVKYELVTDGVTDEERLLNAKYALSLARKIGAQIYALPQDLVEVNSKMVLTVFACLMACAHKKEKEKGTYTDVKATKKISTGRKF